MSARRDMIEKACAKNLFARSAKATVRVPEDLPTQVESALRAHCLSLIGLARRAGQAVAGFEKVRLRLEKGKAEVLIQARDAGDDGRARLARLARAVKPGLDPVELFDAEELGAVFGRSSAVHVVVLPGGLADRLKLEVGRLVGVMGSAAGPAKRAL